MNRTKRAILRWSFIGAFLLVAPVVILTTAGYRFNPGKISLERTGVIIVDSTPRGATVYLNDRRLGPLTPTKATRFFPGHYRLRLEKAGYRDWERDIVIEPGQTTFVSDVLLFRDTLPQFERDLPADQASFSPNHRLLAAHVGGGDFTEVRIVDLQTGQAWTPWRLSEIGRDFDFSWSSDSRSLLIASGGEMGSPDYSVWDAATPDATHSLSAHRWNQAFWSGTDLYVANDTGIYLFNPSTRQYQAAGPAVRSMIVADGIVYGLRPDSGGMTIVHRDLKANRFEDWAVLPNGAYRPLSTGNRAAFVGDNRIFLLDSSGKVTEIPGQDGAWSADGTRFIHWNDLEVRVYNARSGNDSLLVRLGTDVAGGAWLRDDSLIAYAGGGALMVTQGTGPGDRAETKLADMGDIIGFAFSPDDSRAWIVGQLGHQNGLFSLQLK